MQGQPAVRRRVICTSTRPNTIAPRPSGASGIIPPSLPVRGSTPTGGPGAGGGGGAGGVVGGAGALGSSTWIAWTYCQTPPCTPKPSTITSWLPGGRPSGIVRSSTTLPSASTWNTPTYTGSLWNRTKTSEPGRKPVASMATVAPLVAVGTAVAGLATTVTVNERVRVLLARSVALQSTVVAPTPNDEPGGGVQRTVSDWPSSLAVGWV